MRFHLRPILQNLALLGASVVLGLGLGEGVVRVFPGLLSEEARLRLHWAEAREVRTHGDPYLGFLNPARYRGQVQGIDAAFRYFTDEHGFRNPSPWPAEAEIVVLGDSMSFGWGVADDQTWSSLVAASLSRSRLINLGLVGAAPQQYTRIYERFGRSLKPKLIIYGLFPGNDVTDARLFDDWLQAGALGNYDVWRVFRGRGPRPPLSLVSRSYLLALVLQVRASWHSRYPGLTLDCHDGRRLQLVPSLLARSIQRATPGYPDFELVIQAVEDARRHARETGTEFFVLLFPTKEEVYLPLGDAHTPALVPPFIAEFRRRGIPYLDLTPHFHERTGECLFFEIDGHPNASGYRLIADVVLKHLQQMASAYGLSDWN